LKKLYLNIKEFFNEVTMLKEGNKAPDFRLKGVDEKGKEKDCQAVKD